MFVDEVRKLQGAAQSLARRFDASSLSEADAGAALEALARTENMVAAVKAAVACRLADSELWRGEGDRSAAHHLARLSGTSVGSARDAIDTAERAKKCAAVDRCLRNGELSPAQASAITDAAMADPGSEQRLVEGAKRQSLGELRDECARTKAAADPDPEGRHKRIHQARSCRRRSCPDGSAELAYRSTPEELGEIWAVLEGFAKQAFEAGRAEDRRESQGAYCADGLLAMARAAASGQGKGRVSTKVIVRIDWDALLRGYPIEGETCEVAGIGPVPMSVVRAMIDSGDVFLAAVVTRGDDVVNVAHLGRRALAVQQTALQWRDPMCTVLGCHQTAGLEVDHREDWAATKVTLVSRLDRLCSHHHRLKTRRNWQLAAGAGKRPMLPPGHPDHPGTGPPRSMRRTA